MLSPVTYIKEVIHEIKKVSWPSRAQTQKMTLIVLGVSIVVGLYIGVIDFIFQKIMTSIL